MLKRALLTATLCGAALFTTGCLLRFALGVQFAESLSEEIDLIIHAIRTEATTAVCQTDPFFSPDFHRCTYIINGVEIASTVSLLREFGPAGVMIDPIVLELPANTTHIAGTYDGGAGNTGSLIVYPGLSYLPVDDTRTLAARPGKQLAVLDLPAGAPVQGVTYNFNITFRRIAPKGSGPTPIKALLTGKVFSMGKTYYQPLLPCTTDVNSWPTLTLPQGTSPQPIQIPSGFSGCSNEQYRYFAARPKCDLDNDADVDRTDLNLLLAVRNAIAAAGDPRDMNADGLINVNDARYCSTRCTRTFCSD